MGATTCCKVPQNALKFACKRLIIITMHQKHPPLPPGKVKQFHLGLAGRRALDGARNRNIHPTKAPAAPLKGMTAVCHTSTCAA